MLGSTVWNKGSGCAIKHVLLLFFFFLNNDNLGLGTSLARDLPESLVNTYDAFTTFFPGTIPTSHHYLVNSTQLVALTYPETLI